MRHVVLPARGVLLVSTDVHGNLADFTRLEELFARESESESEAHWVILGDVVHGPDATARASHPDWYGYEDESMAIVDRILAVEAAAPGRVHFVLGNHDHGHVGGPHPAKFHADEVEALESGLSEAQRSRLRGLFARALLAAAAPCGVLMTHGSPDASLERLEDLDVVPLELKEMTTTQARMLRSLLTSYGQPAAETRAMLEKVSRASGLELRVVVHGHDRDEAGFFREGGNQVCPVIFGAARGDKRYVRLDLGARYENAEALRDGVEIVRLYGD
jgi:predicted phosphodiesterase